MNFVLWIYQFFSVPSAVSQECFTLLPPSKLRLPKRAISKNRPVVENTKKYAKRGEIPSGYIKFGSQPSRPAIFGQKRFVTLSLSLVRSPFSLPRGLPFLVFFSPDRPPPFSFVLPGCSLVDTSRGRRRNRRNGKSIISPVAMRIIIEYQKLCYSLFHSAHLLPARRFRGPSAVKVPGDYANPGKWYSRQRYDAEAEDLGERFRSSVTRSSLSFLPLEFAA